MSKKFFELKTNPDSAKRVEPEEGHAFRDNFERDRDRILYSKEFRRLSGKTQVFVVGFDDDIRSRLTHTLEVAQISKTICNQLGLNTTLAEAIALGHDVGHTPFGHVGERAINLILNKCEKIKDFHQSLNNKDMGFKHNWQSLRVLVDLEKISQDYDGLNLTNYTLWGILNHSSTSYKPCWLASKGLCSVRRKHENCSKSNGNKSEPTFSLGFYDKYKKFNKMQNCCIEGLIVKMADEIAQRNHDLQDGVFANIIEPQELLKKIKDCFQGFLTDDEFSKLETARSLRNRNIFINTVSQIVVNLLATQLINSSRENLDAFLKKYKISSNQDFENLKASLKEKEFFSLLSFSKEFEEKEHEFQAFLKNTIILSYTAQTMDGKADFIIRQLFKCFLSNPQQLPDSTILKVYQNMGETISSKFDEEPYQLIVARFRNKLAKDHAKHKHASFNRALLRTIADYIAGMTDNYALSLYRNMFGTTN